MFEFLAGSSFVNPHPLLLLFNFIQFINLPMMYLNEKKSAMPYSKFAASFQEDKKEKMIPSKLGMLIIYGPAFVAALTYMLLSSSERITSRYEVHLASWMVMAHFLKRTLEVLFLHKYSGSTVESAAKMIGFAYALQGTLICCTANQSPSGSSLYASTFLFMVGIVGNFYHHYLLACLRSSQNTKGGEKKYTAPKGGLFEYVAAPHYLFELIGWLGIAVASDQITAYLVFAGMLAYLSARSCNQNDWNKKKFSEKEWPRSRKNIIPFIF
jgi:hypothetical protein